MQGCFQCGEIDHWANDCPWKNTLCPAGCGVARKLWTSKQIHSYGKKFLKCIKCGHFERLSAAIDRFTKVNLKVKLGVKLDDLCNAFISKFKEV